MKTSAYLDTSHLFPSATTTNAQRRRPRRPDTTNAGGREISFLSPAASHSNPSTEADTTLSKSCCFRTGGEVRLAGLKQLCSPPPAGHTLKSRATNAKKKRKGVDTLNKRKEGKAISHLERRGRGFREAVQSRLRPLAPAPGTVGRGQRHPFQAPHDFLHGRGCAECLVDPALILLGAGGGVS